MKALIMSIKAGFGHHSTGMAMKECFAEHGWECEMLDTLEYVNRFLCDGVQDGYLLTTKYLKEMYGKVYTSLDKRDEPFEKYSPTVLISRLISKKLVKYIEEYAPDVIIGTHSYAAMLMSIMKDRGHISCPLIGIVTDFTVHPFWESTKLDAYIVPDEMLVHMTTKKGIPPYKVYPTGIPVRKAFSEKHDKAEAKNRLGLLDKPCVLVMMGSMGFGNIGDIITSLDNFNEDFQIVCICGNNKRAKQHIDKMIWKKHIVNIGFTDRVDSFMDAADLIITKPGGLSTSEAMAKGLPLILTNPIPGQEDRNLQLLINSGAAMAPGKTYPLESALHSFFKTSWRADNMREAVSHIGKPNATEDLYELSLKLIESKKEILK